MPRYFFHTRHKDGWLVPDHVGAMHDTDEAVAVEAVHRSRDLALRGFEGGLVEVHDEGGWVVISKLIGAWPTDRTR